MGASELFVQDEDEEMALDENLALESENLTENDDPIIKSIPLILNTLPQSNQEIYILKYPGRPKTRPLTEDYYQTSMKPQSKYLEIKVPLDQTKFFDESKVGEWGETIVHQKLQGVLDRPEPGLYVGQIVRDNSDSNNNNNNNNDNDNNISSKGTEKIVLTAVNSTAQLRPQFDYVDEIDAVNYAQRKADFQESKPSNVQILQSAAKPNSQSNDSQGHNSALGESLKHIKQFEEEDWSGLKYINSNHQTTVNITQTLQTSADNLVLSPQTNMDHYIDMLTS